jgi:hypothetical protein
MNSGILSWAYREDERKTLLDKEGQKEGYLLRGGGAPVRIGDYYYGIGRRNDRKFMPCIKIVNAEHFPVVWRFPVAVFDDDYVEPNGTYVVGMHEIEHPFTRGVNDPSSLFVHRGKLHVSITSCSCACLPADMLITPEGRDQEVHSFFYTVELSTRPQFHTATSVISDFGVPKVLHDSSGSVLSKKNSMESFFSRLNARGLL